MGKKNEKKLCLNCDANVSLHLTDCPYCGANLNKIPDDQIPSLKRRPPFNQPEKNKKFDKESVPKPPYAGQLLSKKDLTVTDEEWKKTIENPSTENKSMPLSAKNEMMALFLLLPGVVFFLFALILILFSQNGILNLSWNENFAYLYFIGSVPLILLGWRALK